MDSYTFNYNREVIANLEARLARQVDRAEIAETRCDDLLQACIYVLTAAEEQVDRCTVYWGEVAEYLRGVIIKAGGKINEPA